MLMIIAQYLTELESGFDVFKYLTLRVILSTLTALALSLIIGPVLIKFLKSKKIGQTVRSDGPQSHLSKAGTPTMGGVLIVLTVVLSTLLWGDLSNRYTWFAIVATLLFASIGFVDDYKKLVFGNSDGLSAKVKFLLMSVFALAIAYAMYITAPSAAETTFIVPFYKDFSWQMGWLFIPFVYLVIVGTSNAVNLTDGLDGLAILPSVLIAGAFIVFAYVTGHVYFSDYLGIPYIEGVGEIAIFCGALVGAGLGFLWFNTYPAQVFMGDTGSLALGAALAVVAVSVRQELILAIMGGIFVMETLSVIIQVVSYKMTGRRVFRMAPIHHHFELKGWPEPRVIVRFWIITVILVLIGLASLKIR